MNAVANRELLNSAVHEAGHVLAARHFGFRVAWVSIDPEFIRHDPLAIKNEIADVDSGVRAVAMVMASERCPDIAAANNQERETVKEYAVEILCGPLAEQLVNPDYRRTAGNDFGQARFFLRRVLAPTDDRYLDKIWIKVENRAKVFVASHEPAILEFANMLMWERTIREAEIDRFIALAKRSADEERERIDQL